MATKKGTRTERDPHQRVRRGIGRCRRRRRPSLQEPCLRSPGGQTLLPARDACGHHPVPPPSTSPPKTPPPPRRMPRGSRAGASRARGAEMRAGDGAPRCGQGARCATGRRPGRGRRWQCRRRRHGQPPPRRCAGEERAQLVLASTVRLVGDRSGAREAMRRRTRRSAAAATRTRMAATKAQTTAAAARTVTTATTAQTAKMRERAPRRPQVRPPRPARPRRLDQPGLQEAREGGESEARRGRGRGDAGQEQASCSAAGRPRAPGGAQPTRWVQVQPRGKTGRETGRDTPRGCRGT